MATKIQWTEETWNPIAGCSVVSPGCTNCYAMRRQAPRLSKNPATPHYHGTVQPSKGGYVWTGKIGIAGDSAFLKPLRTKKATMWFVNSMSDLFHENVPDVVIDRVFAIMALCPQHIFQVLTKRSRRMREYLTWEGRDSAIADAVNTLHPDRAHQAIEGYGNTEEPYLILKQWPLPNVWLGVSVEDQIRADERIPDLMETPAPIRFISAEPLLGPIRLPSAYLALGLRAWTIVGGESGKGARPMHPDWARDLRGQCAVAGVPYFFKQWGEWGRAKPVPSGTPGNYALAGHDTGYWPKMVTQVDQYPRQFALFGGTRVLERIGTKAAGRVLDGAEHNAMPEPPT